MKIPEDFFNARHEMVETQLRARDIHDQRVLHVMGTVPREEFVLSEFRNLAYTDQAMPIDCDQTISQPYIVALMTQALELTGTEKVLEIGTGSGYQAAVLSQLAKQVVTMERHRPLSELAAKRLAELGYDNVTCVIGDGTLGYADEAPYDRIMVTAGGPQVPMSLWKQLSENGLLVIPVGDSQSQVLQAIRKVNGQPVAISLSGCRFVKLIGDEGWKVKR